MSTKLRELQEKLYVKQDAMARIFDQSRRGDGTYDFTEAEAFQHLDNQKACLDMLDQLEKELDDLQGEVKTQEGLEEQEKRLKERRDQRSKVVESMVHPGNGGVGANGLPAVQKSLGQLVAEAWPRDRDTAGNISFYKDFKNYEVKTLMTTAAGWAPESTRIPRIAEFALRPIMVTDLFPISNTDMPSIVFMRETTSTSNAEETAEGAAYKESVLAYTQVTVPVKKITTSLPVTDEQLADVNQVAGIIDARLRFFVQQRLDLQIIMGDGTGDTMTGLLNTASVQTQAKGADDIPSAIYKANVKVRVTGRASPTATIIHPNDFQDVRLMKTSDGWFIWGPPSAPGPMTMWGVPIVETDVISENTAMTGDFAGHAQLWMRQGVEVMAGYVNAQFIEGEQTIRASLRGVVVVYRPTAFCAITGV